MDILVYPGLRIDFVARPIFCIFLDFMFGSAVMIYSAVLKHFILRRFSQHVCHQWRAAEQLVHRVDPNPAYVFIAMSEIFASVTGLEYAPKHMKSFVMAAALSPVAIDPKLVGNYTGIAIATFISGVVFYVLFRKRDEIEQMENQIGKEGRYESEETLTHEEPVSAKKRQDGA